MVISKQDLPLINRFNLNRSSLIEASAGTGKTFTISNLIVRLLMGAPALGNVSEKDRKSIKKFIESTEKNWISRFCFILKGKWRIYDSRSKLIIKFFIRPYLRKEK